MEVSIKNVDCIVSLNGLANIIKSVNWEYGNGTVSITGTVELPEPDQNNFIPFEEITGDMVKEWIQKIVDFNYYDEFMVIEENPQIEIVTIDLHNN